MGYDRIFRALGGVRKRVFGMHCRGSSDSAQFGNGIKIIFENKAINISFL